MKRIKSLIYIFFIAACFNLIGRYSIQLERLEQTGYWIFTVGFAIGIYIADILIRYMFISFVKRCEKQFPEMELVADHRFQFVKLPFPVKLRGVLSTMSIVLIIYFSFIFMLFTVRPENTLFIFGRYLSYYGVFIAVMVLSYVAYVFIKGDLLWSKQEVKVITLEKEVIKEVEVIIEKPVIETIIAPTVLDAYIPIHVLHSVLYHYGGVGPILDDNGFPRMFDVPFYYSSAEVQEVILVNGQTVHAPLFMKELEKRGLDKWFLKINSNYSINMMLVYFPILETTTRLTLQSEIFASLRQRLSQLDIEKLLLLSKYMRKNKKLKDFLDNMNNLRHQGWDDFIPLTKQSSSNNKPDKL